MFHKHVRKNPPLKTLINPAPVCALNDTNISAHMEGLGVFHPPSLLGRMPPHCEEESPLPVRMNPPSLLGRTPPPC